MSELHDNAQQWLLDAGIATTSIVGLHAVKARMLIAELLAEVERLAFESNYWREEAKSHFSRAHIAEARLRELASAEPVAFGHSFTEGAIPLIRRPEMLS